MNFARLCVLLTFLAFGVNLSAQIFWDSQWAFGGGLTSDQVSFLGDKVESSIVPLNLSMDGGVMISDDDGTLLLYSNGCEVRNMLYELVENGEHLNPGAEQLSFCPGGTPLNQSMLLIPKPGTSGKYYLFLLNLDLPYLSDTNSFSVAPTILYFNEIDMYLNQGKGKVVLKNQIAIQDTFGRGSITAVRHGNGRDWFLVIPKSHTNCYFILLADQNGVTIQDTICTGRVWGDLDNLGQANFSPNGRFYARTHAKQGLHLFEFDRCTGDMVYYEELMQPDTIDAGAGVAFSSNSHHLYASIGSKLFQFDLLSDDISESKVLVAERTVGLPSEIKDFYQIQLAMNGKLYAGSTGSFNRLHVVHNPNVKGKSCRVELGGQQLQRSGFYSVPQFPSFRLGPDDFRSCDTLELDNLPVSYFQIDSVLSDESLTVRFRNLSYGEIKNYHWDFGDGFVSSEFEPIHAFLSPGVYDVCLTTSNDTFEHVYCRPFIHDLVGLGDQVFETSATIYPNPANDYLYISCEEQFSEPATFRIFTQDGQTVNSGELNEPETRVEVSGLVPGLYFSQISGGGEVWVRKFVIIR